MKQERIILSFVGILIGLVFAGIGFFLYQSTKVIPQGTKDTITKQQVTPTPAPQGFLTLSQPADESLASSRTITVSGKTDPAATVVVLTGSDQQVVNPSSQGDFSTTVTISSGENILDVIAISPTGQTQRIERTVSYTTADF